jgi:hypothetical protein
MNWQGLFARWTRRHGWSNFGGGESPDSRRCCSGGCFRSSVPALMARNYVTVVSCYGIHVLVLHSLHHQELLPFFAHRAAGPGALRCGVCATTRMMMHCWQGQAVSAAVAVLPFHSSTSWGKLLIA